MDSQQLHFIRKHSEPHVASAYLHTAIAGVLRHAKEGELPLFALTLGLPQQELLVMLASGFPEPGMSDAKILMNLSGEQYHALLQSAPVEFMQLKQLLLDHQAVSVNVRHASWLASAIAAASFGSRHLWQDLGVPGREAVSTLMRDYFTELYLANTQNLKWKRFLFAEPGRKQGKDDLRPPKCTHCDDFHVCFPDSATTA
ncbi:nitrogen fixation protein NifQ [Undibacterium sp. TC4M20W]|uniref:nitrogen fixation protein NifQ n=1 Tax=Undibacterium sp. TC4M20W TaxID=3413052 RepID=UPI003BF15922